MTNATGVMGPRTMGLDRNIRVASHVRMTRRHEYPRKAWAVHMCYVWAWPTHAPTWNYHRSVVPFWDPLFYNVNFEKRFSFFFPLGIWIFLFSMGNIHGQFYMDLEPTRKSDYFSNKYTDHRRDNFIYVISFLWLHLSLSGICHLVVVYSNKLIYSSYSLTVPNEIEVSQESRYIRSNLYELIYIIWIVQMCFIKSQCDLLRLYIYFWNSNRWFKPLNIISNGRNGDETVPFR
jgi:hypothetical protein